MKITFLTVVLFFLCGAAFCGSGDPNTADTKYLKYGEKFNCIGRVVGTYNDNKEFLASGVAIDSHHVLTAAHVVKNSKSCSFITDDGSVLCFEKVIYHKNFTEEVFGKYDIAICYTKEPIPLDSFPALYTGVDEIDKICYISGYGFYGTFQTGAVKSDGKRRAGSNIIDYIDKDLLICTPSKSTDDKFTELEFIIATGDSGGGLFIDGKLAGINSCVLAVDKKPNGSYTDEGGHTRISQYLDWIEENRSK